MKKIIFDCDNTFGVKDCDVDDGLALMYLLETGRPNFWELRPPMETAAWMWCRQ